METPSAPPEFLQQVEHPRAPIADVAQRGDRSVFVVELLNVPARDGGHKEARHLVEGRVNGGERAIANPGAVEDNKVVLDI
jgi:hypothetical protein